MTSVTIPDTALIADPGVYEHGVPHEAFARLRRSSPVVWVDQPAIVLPGLPPMPASGFWAVLRHADVEEVLRSPRLFSSYLGGTQIFDPPFPAVLDDARH